MAQVTIKHGPANTVIRQYGTLGDLKRDRVLEQYFGADFAATAFLVNGQAAGDTTSFREGDVVDLRSATHTKGC